jgi:radical SAM superfamily enzyme YgiQ (UPF0313 family)
MHDHIQFVFCGHTCGHLAHEEGVPPQPPLGLLVIAAHLRSRFPSLSVQVYAGWGYDEDELLNHLDAPVVGLSVWFSNYEASCSLARRVKEVRPNTTVIMGGPHATWLARRILSNLPFVDLVVLGEGEVAIERYLRGEPPEEIPAFVSRLSARNSADNDSLPSMSAVSLDEFPEIDMDLLRPPYEWKGRRGGPAMSAFPLSGVRGCQRGRHRCEYCSMHTRGYRMMSPERYWREVSMLHDTCGIDFFFETGDTCVPAFYRRVASVRDHPDVGFRIYSYPGTNKESDIPLMKSMGVDVVFMGIESVLHWSSDFQRQYRREYTIESLVEEVKAYADAGIRVWPGFLLGLPGEDPKSLKANVALIRRVTDLPNVHEATVSTVLPLPGTRLFEMCCADQHVVQEYGRIASGDLSRDDAIDYYLLARLYADRFTGTGYALLGETVEGLRSEFGDSMANWGSAVCP